MEPAKFPNQIKGRRIYLKALKLEDNRQLFTLINSQRQHIGKYLDWVENVKTLDDEKKYVSASLENSKKLNEFNWCIYKNETNEFIGFIGTDPVSMEAYKSKKYIDWDCKTVSFAYFMDQNHSGHGYMTEALGLLKTAAIKFGFRRLEINSDENNIKSHKVAERCGFVHDEKDPGKMYFENKEKL